MQIKESAELYLETIYTLGLRGGGVRAVDVAAQLDTANQVSALP